MNLAARQVVICVVFSVLSSGCSQMSQLRSRDLTTGEKAKLTSKSAKDAELPMLDDLDSVKLAQAEPGKSEPTTVDTVSRKATNQPATPADKLSGADAKFAQSANPADQAIAQLIQQSTGPAADTSTKPLAGKVATLGKQIVDASGSSAKIQFEVINNQRARTYHSTSGRIYVTSGVFDKVKTERELAAVLAYQVAEYLTEVEREAKNNGSKPLPELGKGNLVGNSINFKSSEDRARAILSKTPFSDVSVAESRSLLQQDKSSKSPGLDRGRMNRQLFEGMTPVAD